MNEEVVLGLGIGETDEADMGAKSVVQVKCLESVLGEDSPPSDFPKETLVSERN